MVLAGTVMTALVAYYILPYGWSFDLCMTFGSILAATDPVAVSVLLNELGAPARLKVHISGESLLNDGSAVVFFHIFSLRFFAEMGLSGVGEHVGLVKGFILFVRLALGGACIGLLFGIGLVGLLFNLNRRLSQTENVIQVTCTITIAYLAFFVSEIICHCSGILAVVVCGLTTKAFGETLLNDHHLTHDFWHITEHLLNSVLFTMAGAIWGGIIMQMNGVDWLYLLVLYGLVVAIRFALVFAFYPITTRMGIGQSLKEAIFMSYGGLRGAVGISLALLLSAEVYKYTESDSQTSSQYREFVEKLFGLTGGVSFLTLVINGPTSGPILKRLGLVTPTETRKSVVSNYEQHMKEAVLLSYLSLLEQKRFADVDFGIVREHVSPLQDVTQEDFDAACKKYQQENPASNLDALNLTQYVSSKSGEKYQRSVSFQGLTHSSSTSSRLSKNGHSSGRPGGSRETVYDYSVSIDESKMLEERSIFINLLRQEYSKQLESGQLDTRGFIPLTLLRSLDIADEAAAKGFPLNDWAACLTAGGKLVKKGEHALHSYRVKGLFSRQKGDKDFHTIRTRVLQALSFSQAHERAQDTFKIEFSSVRSNSLTLAEKTVIDESRNQVTQADAAICAFDDMDVKAVKSQYVCQVLLHRAAAYFEQLTYKGLMTERELGEHRDKYDLELRDLRISSELKADAHLSRRGQIAPMELGLG